MTHGNFDEWGRALSAKPMDAMGVRPEQAFVILSASACGPVLTTWTCLRPDGSLPDLRLALRDHLAEQVRQSQPRSDRQKTLISRAYLLTTDILAGGRDAS